ncbi:hypothetical protein N8664_01015 [Verrucomicrobia bacterium]|nr:hypothetical protein [Verrucomicrobiota bacterium]
MNELESSVEAAPKWIKLQLDQTDWKTSSSIRPRVAGGLLAPLVH